MTRLQDTSAPYLDLALSRRRMRDMLAERVVPKAFPGHTLRTLPMPYSRYKAGRRYVALYRLDLEPPLRGDAPLVTATFGRATRLAETFEAIAHCGTERASTAFFLADVPCLVEVFPSDGRLPLLWRAAHESRASSVLAPMLPAYTNVSVNHVELLRYRPGRRCVLAYEIEHSQGKLHLVGKLYSDAEQAGAVASKMRSLAEPHPAIKLPALVGNTTDDGLLLMERLPGSNLGDELENTTDVATNERAVRAAARGLAAFHAFSVRSADRRSIQSEISSLRSRAQKVRSLAPDLGGQIMSTLDQVDARLERLPAATECTIHGEYKPNQLLIDGGQIAVVDLDRACTGDPALDVGNFAAILRKEALLSQNMRLALLADVFLAEYREATRADVTIRRAHLFQVVASLRILARHVERAPQDHARLNGAWPPLALLSEAQRLLLGAS